MWKTRLFKEFLRHYPCGLPEHRSDTYVFTMRWKSCLSKTSNSLMVGDLCESLRVKLVSMDIDIGSSKDGDGDTSYSWTSISSIACSTRLIHLKNQKAKVYVSCFRTLISNSLEVDQLLKFKGNFKKTNNHAFHHTRNGMSMIVQCSRAQVGERPQVADRDSFGS
ncbi:hypothetical protein Tco_0669979 [Tanacetum coccineum]